MSTFDSTKALLPEILREIQEGTIQLPDFQRGWVWDDDHIRDLLVSIARSFPIGAVMLLEAGGEVRFQTRPIEGLEDISDRGIQPEKLILDGQQRLTTLTQALSLDRPVRTRNAKGKRIDVYYYFDIRKALDGPHALEEAVVAVDERRQMRSDFGRRVDLDLSTTELECSQLYFPCRQVMNSDQWESELYRIAPSNFGIYMEFRKKILSSFRIYQIPIILLRKETSREAVCIVFEKVNTGGVPLSVFELVTATYAADGYNLRDDWFGSRARNIASRKERLEAEALLEGIEATEFMQAVTLLYTHELHDADTREGGRGSQIRPVSAKRADVLRLPLDAWKQWADAVEAGFLETARFLRAQGFYSRRELPYSTQLVPLAAVMARLGSRWQEPRVYDKLARWYWCGVLGELYGGAVETRIANDYEDLLNWIDDDSAIPRTVREATFSRERFYTLRSRLSAAYKGLQILILREGAMDWCWKRRIKDLNASDVALDIHHIFPRSWCEKHGVKRELYDCVLNKTTLSYRSNRTIGGSAPSEYIKRLEKETGLEPVNLDKVLATHALDASLLRRDAFYEFLEDRAQRLASLIESVMGKPVIFSETMEQYDEDAAA